MAEEAYESAPDDPLAIVARRAGEAEDGPLAMPVAYRIGSAVYLPRDELQQMAGVMAAHRERINRELSERQAGLVREALAGEIDEERYLAASVDLEVECRLRLADIYEAAADSLGTSAFAGTFSVPDYVFDNDDIAAGRTTLEDLRQAMLKEGFGLRGTVEDHLREEFAALTCDEDPAAAPSAGEASDLDAVWEQDLCCATLSPPDSRLQTLERRLAVVGGAAARGLLEAAQVPLLEALIDHLRRPERAWKAWVLLAILTRREEKLVECFAAARDGWWETLGRRSWARWQAWYCNVGSLRWCPERGCFLPEQAVLQPAPRRISLAILLGKKAYRLGRVALKGLSVGGCKALSIATLKRLGALKLDADPDTFALYSPKLRLLPAEDQAAEPGGSQGLLLVAAPAAVRERPPGQMRPVTLGSGVPRFTQKMFANLFVSYQPAPEPPHSQRVQRPRRATDRFLNAPPELLRAEPSALEAAEIEVGCCLVGLSANIRLKIRTRRERVNARTLRKVLFRALSRRLLSDALELEELLAIDEETWLPAPLETPLKKAGALMFVARHGTVRLTDRTPGWYALPLQADGESVRQRFAKIRGMECSLELEIPRHRPRSTRRMLKVFHCPCGRKLAARPEHAGKRTVCPQCKRKLRVPGKKKHKPAGS